MAGKLKIVAGVLPLVIVSIFSTESPVMSSDMPLAEGQSYCDLLHVPEDTETSIRPRQFLGITMSSVTGDYTDACSAFIRVKGIVDGSPAEKAGMREDDIILSVNDMPVCEAGSDLLAGFKRLIEGQTADSEITLHILRSGQQHSLSARLAERPYIQQKEADHELPKTCSDRPSFLKSGLMKEMKLSLFQGIRSDLVYQSNRVHNPDWILKNSPNPYQLREFTYMLRRPLQSGEIGRKISEGLVAVPQGGELRISRAIDTLSGLLDAAAPFSECRLLTLEDLIRLIEKANMDLEPVFQKLSADEILLIREHVFNPWGTERWNEILAITLKVELKELISAIYPIIACMTEDNLSSLRADILMMVNDTGGTSPREIRTSFGKVFIGGLESDTYTEDAALILDPGGDDIYLNNAGASRGTAPVAVVIDWEGNDLYLSREKFSQGAGFLGGGILIDLDGNNVFNAVDGAQGAGFYGIGILYNKGGASTLNSGTFSQGVGQFGIGLLWNNDADSLYQSSGYGQALGLFHGAGVLVDVNGNDRYLLGGRIPDFRDPERATVSMGQGFGKGIRPDTNRHGVSGGIGVLIDATGDDLYLADYFSQGSSYYYGTGILDDRSGNDRYFSGRYSQGAGIHASVGIFIESSGDDSYHASHGVSQGMGHDFGTGYFEDSEGDDRYFGGTLVQGAATYGGLGIILDRRGMDRYAVRDKGQAFADDETCMGIMLDLDSDRDTVSGHPDSRSLRIGTKQ